MRGAASEVAPDALRAAAEAARDARMADRDAAAERDDEDEDGGEEGAGGKRTRAADGSAAKPDFPRLKQQAVRAAAPYRDGCLCAASARWATRHTAGPPPAALALLPTLVPSRRARRRSTASCLYHRIV